MHAKTWNVPQLVIGVVALACSITDLVASFGTSSPNTSLTETVPLYRAGTPAPVSGERIAADSANRVTLLARLSNGVIA